MGMTGVQLLVTRLGNICGRGHSKAKTSHKYDLKAPVWETSKLTSFHILIKISPSFKGNFAPTCIHSESLSKATGQLFGWTFCLSHLNRWKTGQEFLTAYRLIWTNCLTTIKCLSLWYWKIMKMQMPHMAAQTAAAMWPWLSPGQRLWNNRKHLPFTGAQVKTFALLHIVGGWEINITYSHIFPSSISRLEAGS